MNSSQSRNCSWASADLCKWTEGVAIVERRDCGHLVQGEQEVQEGREVWVVQEVREVCVVQEVL